MQTPTRTTFSTEVPESSCFSLVLVGAYRKDALTMANLLVGVTSWIAHGPSHAQVGLRQALLDRSPSSSVGWHILPRISPPATPQHMVGVMTYKPWNVQP